MAPMKRDRDGSPVPHSWNGENRPWCFIGKTGPDISSHRKRFDQRSQRCIRIFFFQIAFDFFLILIIVRNALLSKHNRLPFTVVISGKSNGWKRSSRFYVFQAIVRHTKQIRINFRSNLNNDLFVLHQLTLTMFSTDSELLYSSSGGRSVASSQHTTPISST